MRAGRQHLIQPHWRGRPKPASRTPPKLPGEGRRITHSEWLVSRQSTKGQWESFRQPLAHARWVDGRNFEIFSRWAVDKIDRVPILANHLKNIKVDVILLPLKNGD